MGVIPDWTVERRQMVERQLRKRGIHDRRVLNSMLEVPREEFVPPESRLVAYFDGPVHIGYSQTISQPYMTALMAELLELRGSEKVLEVGTGSGYAAAVLGLLAARVLSLEFIPGLAHLAEENLRRTHRDSNIKVIHADGSLGYPELAPFDAISVAAAAPEIPEALLDQLASPGRLVIPVGDREDQELRIVTKNHNRIDYQVVTLCRFVPLRGGEGWN